MREALVAQQFADPDDLRPLATFGLATRELVDVNEELVLLAIDLGVAGIESGGPNERGQVVSADVRRHADTAPAPVSAPSRLERLAGCHFDGWSEVVRVPSCENAVNSSAQRPMAFAANRRWCSTTCSGLRQESSSDHASIASNMRAWAQLETAEENACVPSSHCVSARLLLSIRSDHVAAQAPACDAWRCCVMLVASSIADPPVTLRETTCNYREEDRRVYIIFWLPT